MWPSVRSICTLKRTFITERQSPASSLRVWCRAGWSQGTGACPWVCVCVCVYRTHLVQYTWHSLSHSLSGLRNRVRHIHIHTHTSCLQHSTHFRKGGFVTTLSPGQPFNTTSCMCVTDWACTRSQWYSQGWILVQDRRELSVRLRKWAAPHPGWERLKDAPSISVTRGLSLAYRQDGHFFLRSVHTNAVLGH